MLRFSSALARKATPKIVFAGTLKQADFADRVIGDDDFAEQVAELKRQDGKDLLLTGGSGSAAALTEHGLIDEYPHRGAPARAGRRPPLFVPRAERLGLRLVDPRVPATVRWW